MVYRARYILIVLSIKIIVPKIFKSIFVSAMHWKMFAEKIGVHVSFIYRDKQ